MVRRLGLHKSSGFKHLYLCRARGRATKGRGRWAEIVALAALSVGCERASELMGAGDVSVAMAKPESGGAELLVDAWQAVPVPDADGPFLYPISMKASIAERPEPTAKTIGYLRLGAKVARSPNPVSRERCEGGWYAVRPVGFVCADADVTLDENHPLTRAISVEPDRRSPMPYSYAFVRAIAPNYLQVPTKAEQLKYEMRLERHLRNYHKLREKWDELDVGANDVPLGEDGLAVGKIPDHARPLDENSRFGGNGDDTVPWWLDGERRIPNVSHFRAPPYAVIADRIKRHAGVALIGTFVGDERAQSRRFAITTDARLLPADKLKADSGSPFHGQRLAETGLPVAFVREDDARFWRYENGKLSRDERALRRQFVPLTGTVKRLGGHRMVQTRDGRWLRSKQLRTVAKPSGLPWFAKGTRRWIDVSILNQTLVLWEGATPVYATLVSTGRDGIGDPDKTLSTPTGTFRIEQKHVTTTMDSTAADSEFELRDVPWVMYFKGGYALHAAYWHDDFGRARSHGCVNLAPIDARHVFHWSSPDVPEHWHGSQAGDAFGKGTLVHVKP